MNRIYCAYSPCVDARAGNGVVFKFGYCENKRDRFVNMNEGWPVEGRRAPALALCRGWRWVFSHSGPKEAETELLVKLSESYPVSWLTAALEKEMIEEAERSKVPKAKDNLNGVGEIRLVGDDAVFNPDGWLNRAQLKSSAAILVFKQACRFARRIQRGNQRAAMLPTQMRGVIHTL